MTDSFWHVVRDEQHRKQSGEYNRRKREEAAKQANEQYSPDFVAVTDQVKEVCDGRA